MLSSELYMKNSSVLQAKIWFATFSEMLGFFYLVLMFLDILQQGLDSAATGQ